MELEYKQNEPVLASELAELFKRSGIRRPYDNHERIQRMIDNANEIISVWDNERLIGILRAITDYSYCCYISDIAVDKEYQGYRIGTMLLDLLLSRLGNEEIKYILTSAPNAIGFYEKYGFERNDNTFIIRRQIN